MGFDLQAHQELRRLSYTVNCLVRDFCCRAKRCFGISPQGDSNLVLNQQGDWVPTGSGGDIQTLLSDLPEYLGAKEASLDGKPIGYWYYNTFNNTVTRVTNYISSYTAGTSTIDFTNNGGDDWDVGFKIALSNMSSGWSVTSYDYVINFYQGGSVTHNESGTKTADFTSPNLSHGAGVYALSCQYNMTNGVDTSYILIGYLIKVDGSGNILGAIKNNGLIVNSVNGLNVNYTAYLIQSMVSDIVNVDSVDFLTSTFTTLSHSLSDTVTLPLGTGGIIVYTNLDATFWVDLGSLVSNPFQLGNFYITTIS